MNDLKQKTTAGFVYKFLERAGASGIKFILSIILARILLPEEYGIVAIVLVIVTLMDVLVTYGFGSSLVADKDSDQIDFSTCFYFGLFLALILYAVFYFVSPYLATWFSIDKETGINKYDIKLLTMVFRVMGLRMPLAAINSVQHAYVQKHLLFKKFFYSTLIGTIITGIIAIVMAYRNYGVWALVEQYLGNVILDTLFLFIFVKWHPTLDFSFKRLKKIYDYGWKILVVGLIDKAYAEIRSIIIGKQYTSSDLAYYNKGQEFPQVVNDLVEPTTSTVMFSSLSKCNDDITTMRKITRRSIKVATFLIFPMIIGLACVAKPLIIIVLTEKWSNSIVFLQIACLAFLFRPIQYINNCVIKSSGQSSLLLKLDIIKKAIGIILLLISFRFGVVYIALSLVITNLISTFINIGPNKRILNYGYKEQILDFLPNLLISLVMGLCVYLLSYINLPMILLLAVQILTGIALYVLLCIIFKNESFFYIIDFVKSKIKKRGV